MTLKIKRKSDSGHPRRGPFEDVIIKAHHAKCDHSTYQVVEFLGVLRRPGLEDAEHDDRDPQEDVQREAATLAEQYLDTCECR